METSHSPSAIDGTGIETTLQDLSVLQVSNTEIFTLICLRIFLLVKTPLTLFPPGFEEHFTRNLLPSRHVLLALYIVFKHQEEEQ